MILDIFQRKLDIVSDALMQDDFDACIAAIDLPFVLLSEAGTTIMTTSQDIRAGFDRYVGLLRSQRATNLMRLAQSVSEYGPGLITGRYDTQVLCGANRVVGPYSSAMSLRLVKEDWKIASIVTPLVGDTWPSHPIPFRLQLRGGPERQLGP